MPFKESSPGPSDPRPETYDQYKQERGGDLRAADMAAYFNNEMHSAILQLQLLQVEAEKLTLLQTDERKKILKRLNKMEQKLENVCTIAKDAWQLIRKNE